MKARNSDIDYVSWAELPTWSETYKKLKAQPDENEIQTPIFPVWMDLNERVVVTKADITKLKVDAIVNAANSSLLGGGGVDGAIHAAAGKDLYNECAQLRGCATGQAKITLGYNLPARHVIHTVGPKGEDEKHLRSCYNACLELCLDNKLRTVAFPCISTGVYGYPEEPAAEVALLTVRQWLEKHWRDIDCIIFCTFSDSDLELYKSLMPRYFPLKLPPIHETSVGKLNAQGLGPLADTRSSATKKAS